MKKIPWGSRTVESGHLQNLPAPAKKLSNCRRRAWPDCHSILSGNTGFARKPGRGEHGSDPVQQQATRIIRRMKFDADLVQSRFETPLGPVTLAASSAGLAGVWFDGQKHLPQPAKPWPEQGDHTVLQEAVQQLKAYFAGQRSSFDLPLDMRCGSAFQQAVWQALLKIPAGATCSYAALSTAIGRPSAVRAVGAAIGRNPLSVVVPCHRVIGSAGSLTGYAGGLDRKSALLRLEGAL